MPDESCTSGRVCFAPVMSPVSSGDMCVMLRCEQSLTAALHGRDLRLMGSFPILLSSMFQYQAGAEQSSVCKSWIVCGN